MSKKKDQSPLLNFNFSFDNDFEFDSKDEISSLKKRVKTEEEIEKCAVSEDLVLSAKGLYILKKGYEVQKKSVVSNLEQYLCEDFACNDELLPLILNSIEVWDTEFQCLFAQSLGRASDLKDGVLSAKNLQKAIELCLDFCDNLNNDDVYTSWSATFSKLANQLNFLEDDYQIKIVQKVIYPKIIDMIDRKQERTRRIRGSNLMRDLMMTQSAEVLTNADHFKHFQTLSRETNFIFRSEMAESLGNIKFYNSEKQMFMTVEHFQEFYYDELIELVSDSDNMVRIKAFEAAGKLIYSEDHFRESYLLEKQVADDILPVFLRLTETVLEDEDGMQMLSNRLGPFVYRISRKFENLVQKNAQKLSRYFEICCKSGDPQTRQNAAYNFPCIFSIFGKMKIFDFADQLQQMSKIEEEKQTRMIVGGFMHEIFKICEVDQQDPFEFVQSFQNILSSELEDVQFTVLPNLGASVNILNRYFKLQILNDLWDNEKFSIKESQNEPDVEKYTIALWDVTHGILHLENQIQGRITKYWREMKTFYEQVIIIIDGQESTTEESISSREPIIQYFMLNKFCTDLMENAFQQMLHGVFPIRYASLDFIAKLVINIASSIKRQQIINEMRQCCFFEFTNSSQRQIMYLIFCNQLMPHFSAKFFKSQILGDLLKHASQDEKSPQRSTQLFFLENCIEIMNDHLTYQDQDLAIQLINLVDILKQSEDLKVSDTAFSVDERVAFNYGQIPSMKKKAFQRMEMIKLAREKKLGVREQFELEHEDASINWNGDERRKSEEDLYYLTQGIGGMQVRERRLINKWSNYNTSKKVVSTFGTVKRFAPEPGSVLSRSQQKVLTAFKKNNGVSISSVNLVGQNSAEIQKPDLLQSSQINGSSKNLLKNTRIRPLRSQSKSQQRRDLRIESQITSSTTAGSERLNVFQRGHTQNQIVDNYAVNLNNNKEPFKQVQNNIIEEIPQNGLKRGTTQKFVLEQGESRQVNKQLNLFSSNSTKRESTDYVIKDGRISAQQKISKKVNMAGITSSSKKIRNTKPPGPAAIQNHQKNLRSHSFAISSAVGSQTPQGTQGTPKLTGGSHFNNGPVEITGGKISRKSQINLDNYNYQLSNKKRSQQNSAGGNGRNSSPKQQVFEYTEKNTSS